MRDAKTKLSMEECASSMVQRSNCAAVKDARINPGREEYAEDTEHTAAPDESTAFASFFGSGFEDPTVPYPSQLNPAASMNQGSLPEEVVVCGVVGEYFEEV